MATDLTTFGSTVQYSTVTAFWNRRVPIMVFTGTFASDDPDKKYLMTFWEYIDLFFWNTTTAWRINTWLLQGLPTSYFGKHNMLYSFDFF